MAKVELSEAAKAAKRAYNAAWRASHREQIKAYNAAWRAAHREQIKACQAAWAAEHAEQRKAAIAAWRAAHPEKVKAYNRISKERKRARRLAEWVADMVSPEDLDEWEMQRVRDYGYTVRIVDGRRVLYKTPAWAKEAWAKQAGVPYKRKKQRKGSSGSRKDGKR